MKVCVYDPINKVWHECQPHVYTDADRERITEFSKTLIKQGTAGLYGLVAGPEENEEHLKERLRLYLSEVHPR